MSNPNEFRNDSAKLTNAEWAALERIAAHVGALATTGPTAGKPSWRRLLKDIANSDLRVVKFDLLTHMDGIETTRELVNEYDCMVVAGYADGLEKGRAYDAHAKVYKIVSSDRYSTSEGVSRRYIIDGQEYDEDGTWGEVHPPVD